MAKGYQNQPIGGQDMIDINGTKLRMELEKRGLDLKETSRKIGYNEYRLADYCNNGRISNIALNYLENKGITLDDITGGEDTWKETRNKRVKIDSDILRNYKEEHHTTYTEMAKRIGRRHSFISNYATGANKEMYIQDVIKLKERLGIDVTYQEPKKWQEVAQETADRLEGKPKAIKKFEYTGKKLTELTDRDLHRIIYSAVLSAIDMSKTPKEERHTKK